MNKFFGLIGLIVLLAAAPLHAQPGDPGGDPDVPITGIEWLLGAGALYGAKKLAFGKNKKTR